MSASIPAPLGARDERRSVRRLLAPWACLCSLLASTPGAGEEAPSLSPPVLVGFVHAPFPSQGSAVPRRGQVTLHLGVDEEGRVVDVATVSATHPAFVGPAERAARGFLFEPARREGRPIPAIVVYRYQFAAPGPPPAVTPRPPPAASEDSAPPPLTGGAVSPGPADYETVVREAQVFEGTTERRLALDEIKHIPGIHGDPVLAVQTLPGVAKPPAMIGALFIRGSDDASSLSLIDSLPVPTVFHFGAVNAVVNSDLIEGVSFIPGNFSVRYGRATGGVIDLETRAPERDRLHAYLDLDIWDAAVFAEGPLTRGWSLAASFRRSYVDGVLRATGLLEDKLRFTVAPRYYDFQVKGHYRSGKAELSLFAFGSDDKVVIGDGLLADMSYLTHVLFTRTYFYSAGFRFQYRFAPGVTHVLSMRAGFVNLEGQGGAVKTRRQSIPVEFRDELSVALSDALLLRVGIDGGIGRHRLEIHDEAYALDKDRRRLEGHPGAYAELTLSAIPRTRFIYGLRVDFDSMSGNVSADPRLEVRVTPLPSTTLRAGLGLFHQPPALFDGFEDAEKKSTAAVHYHLGLEQTLPIYPLLHLDVTGFYKDLRRTDFSHRERGRAFGLELRLQHRPSSRFFGWISYTLMRSERSSWDDPEPVVFDFDQTHVLTAVAGLSLGRGVRLGVRFRLASGFPYTPIIGYKFYDDWSATEMPLWGDANAARMPNFHQLDLRVDKTFVWSRVSLSVYLDVQNVYNRQNPILYLYSSDLSSRKTLYDLPVLPSVGVRVAY